MTKSYKSSACKCLPGLWKHWLWQTSRGRLRPSVRRGKITQSLGNQTVVITGASSGFGQGEALKFADEGANLVLAARRKRLLKDVAAECEQRGARALAVETDVSCLHV